MSELAREMLYPLGFVAALLFAARFVVQWLSSEMQKKSVLPKSFWYFSLAGNIMLFIHAWIQLQFHVFAVQACNAVISWRNLNLMQPSPRHLRFSTVVVLLITALLSACTIFYLQGVDNWFRVPKAAWLPDQGFVDPIWHVIGFIGIILFASRFWVQWISSELIGKSVLGKPFWWLSLVGDLLIISYFYRIADPANLIGPALGLIPYVRNLMLQEKEEAL